MYGNQYAISRLNILRLSDGKNVPTIKQDRKVDLVQHYQNIVKVLLY